nr:immunoglobulin light chain junction region [Macaca mulatta]MPO11353.1 immunoglobulin light chain junction region [Macaca mulatta]
CSSYAGSDVLF